MNSNTIKNEFKKLKALVQRQLRSSYQQYLQNILSNPHNPQKVKRSLWSIILFVKQHLCIRRSSILNSYYQSIFTEENNNIPDKGLSPFPTMPDININMQGVLDLLKALDVHKAYGPDNIPPRVLKEAAYIIAPLVTELFRRYLQSGEVPLDWRLANITLIMKKGDRSIPSNYQPISLTSVTSKLLEHIIVSNMMNHLETNSIFVDCQHGFRQERSCETQLDTFVNELLEAMNND